MIDLIETVSIQTIQNLQSHRTELTKNSLMVDPIKGCAEINLHGPSLLPTLQCTLQCMEHAQKYIKGRMTFPTRKFGGWNAPLRSISRPRRINTRR